MDIQELLVQLDLLVPPVLQALRDSPERRETEAMPSQSVVIGERRAIPASPDHPVSPAWTGDPVVTDSLDLLDPKELLALRW